MEADLSVHVPVEWKLFRRVAAALRISGGWALYLLTGSLLPAVEEELLVQPTLIPVRLIQVQEEV
jgi:hypothetical protein